MFKRTILLLTMCMILLAGCRESQKATPTPSIRDMEISVNADSLVIGDTSLSISVMAGDNPVVVDKLEVRGDMDHPGMVPITREINGQDDGEYTVPFEWTMAGDWYVEVDATLPNGEQFLQRFEFPVESDGDEPMDHEGMDMDAEATDETHDHGAMDMDAEATDEAHDHDGMDMGSGAVTASYMLITNNGDSDDALISVETEAAASVEIHQTMMENDVMRMMPAEDTSIPADESLTMEPGGMHLMLIDLQQDLKVDETITLTLTFESGTEVQVEAVIQDMPPEDSTITEGDITIENAWVRPMNR